MQATKLLQTLSIFFQTFQKDTNSTQCSAVHPWCLAPHIAACSYIYFNIMFVYFS
uniref:Uncharacterized protein n=1 Tax=Anguilla anguilla TaxID=7936 RepID=A0A0E9WL46_ANGAN